MYVGLPFLSTPPLERRRVLIGSLSVAFAFKINASQFGASGGAPVHRPSLMLLWHLYCDHTGQPCGSAKCARLAYTRLLFV